MMLRIPKSIAMYFLAESSREQFLHIPLMVGCVADCLDRCEYFGLVNSGELVGAVVYEPDGNIHYHMTRAGSLSRKLLRLTINYGLEQYGAVLGYVAAGNDRMLRIARWLGAIEMDCGKVKEFVFEGAPI